VREREREKSVVYIVVAEEPEMVGVNVAIPLEVVVLLV
jgi:hypothetical protein